VLLRGNRVSGVWGVTLAGLICGAVTFAHGVAAGEAPVSELQGVVSEWIDLRSTISRERQDWDGEEERLKAYLTVLVRRRDGLADDVVANQAVQTSAADRVGELAQRRGELEAMLAEFEPHLAQAELAAQQWLAIIPDVLRKALPSAGGAAPATEPMTVAARLQRYLSLCADLEALRSRVHITRQDVETEGQRYEYQMLYLGTAQAYGITPDHAKAVWGAPYADGWRWRRVDAQAREIAVAIDIVAGDAPAAYLTLPVVLPVTAPIGGREVSE
jgi:hypothetical protein